MKALNAISLSLLLPSFALAAPYGAAWSLLPSSTRDAGMAGGLGVMARGVESATLDASALGGVKQTQAYLSHSHWHQDVKADHGGMAYALGQAGAVAVAVDWVDLGSVTRYQTLPGGGVAAAGEWRPSAGVATLAWGRQVSSNFSLGAQVRGWRQSLDQENEMAASAGVSGRYSSQAWTLDAGLRDVGSGLGGNELPTQARLGLAVAATPFMQVGFEALRYQADGSLELLAGAEVNLGKSLTLRGGAQRGGSDTALTPSVGASFKVGNLAVDVASAFSALGSTLQAGFSWSAF
jgi:hypothetical protein